MQFIEKKLVINKFEDYFIFNGASRSSCAWRVFHNEGVAVPISRLPSFTFLLLFGNRDPVLAHLRCLAEWYQFNRPHVQLCIKMKNF